MTADAAVPGDGPVPVPFAGLRRHARALAVGLALVIGIVVLVPDIAPATVGEAPVLLVRGRIVELLDAVEPGQPDARIVVVRGIEGGPVTGDVIDAVVQGAGRAEDRPDVQVGAEVIVQVSTDPDAPFVAVSDRYRGPLLAWLVGLFALAVIAVGGWRGVRSLIALALTLVVVIRLVVPLILAGWDPTWVAIVTATGVTIATVLLTEGARWTTLAAVLGTALSLTLVAVLASVFDALAQFSPLRGSESAGFLASIGGLELDLGGLMLASVIFGALGVLDDVTVTQAATVAELRAADPWTSGWSLAGRAMNVGRSHIAATVNTLVLAYVGASLPLIVLFAAGGQDPALIASTEAVAVEVIRALVGSIGIVAAVPLTTAIAVVLLEWAGDRGRPISG